MFEIQIALTVAGMIIFFNMGESEARDGSPNYRMLWAVLSLIISALVQFVAGWGWLPWLVAQIGLFVGIAAVRMWVEEPRR